MDKKAMNLDFEIRFEEIKELNPSFDIAKVAVAYHGLNRNRSLISKEVFEKAKESMKNIPIVGRYIPEDENFGGHDIMVVEENGRQNIVSATVPFGVVPESSNMFWEEIKEDDGTTHEYLIVDCIIWKRSYGYMELVSKKTWGQSMEITVNDYEFDDNDVMIIKDMSFSALCILGEGIEPCFESADIQFSVNPDDKEFRENFSAMLGELKELSLKFNEGGNAKLDVSENLETVDANEVVVEAQADLEELNGENETSEEGEVVVIESSNDEASSNEDASFSAENTDNDLDFSKTYKQLYDTLSSLVTNLCVYDDTNDDYAYYYLCDFDDKYVFACKRKRRNGEYSEEYVRMSFSKVADKYELGPEEQMVIKWLTLEEEAKLESERDELTSLRQYKAEVEANLKKEITNNLVSEKFSDIVDTDEFKSLGEAIYEMDVDTLTEKLYAIKGRLACSNVETSQFSKKEPEEIKIAVGFTKKESANKRYGDLFEKFAINK